QLNLLRNRSELLLKLADRIVRPFKETGRLMPIAPVDVALVINDGLTRLEAELKDITVRTTIPANLPHGLSVEYQLCEVVYDLMDNAREAMADVDPRVLSVYAHYLPDTNQVEIDIGDTGRGVPEEFATKLFSPGVGTKKDKLGIGLWYGRIFMRASGGDLYLKDTKPGIGTTFTLVIPCVPHYEATAEVHSDKEPRDILIVDDDADYVQQIRTIIGRDKYAIEVAHDYASAVNFLDSYSFKLAILDVALAGGDPENTDGLRLLETIETSIPGTKVIMITGNIGARVEQHEEIAKRASKLVAFVHKSGVTLEGLRQQIAEVF
ncbi:MAG: hybrid sensor histidine kinase/response regulator, partial [Anaerolineae bacterium]|nr:hybrid sensor histidine kinase/response regulator [Anaerolineae bacterium]